MAYYDAATVKEAARGRWFELLVSLGIDSDFLQDVHGPCPGCKGKDRFRFDNQDDDGTFICSQGGGELLSGDGFALLMHVKQWDFSRTLDEIGRKLEVATAQPPRDRAPPRPSKAKAVFHRDRLAEFAARWRPFVDTAWLADRSPEPTYKRTPEDFLRALYRPNERVVVFTEEFTQGQAIWPNDTIPVSGLNGVLFLCQPIDGKFHPSRRLDEHKKPTMSRRAKEAVTSWRYLVIESDEARARDWLAALVQLPLAIAAIYTSGSRSIHALVRVDATSLEHWRAISAEIKPIMVTLGADKGVIATAVRLSRLPGCWREGKTIKETDGNESIKRYVKFSSPQLQKLLYLDPNPSPRPICAMPCVRDTISILETRALPFVDWNAGELIERHLRAKGIGYVVLDGKKVFANVDLKECELALADAEKIRERPYRDLDALRWFESAKPVRALIDRLRGKVDGLPPVQ